MTRRKDILLWDTGHQAYVHKLLTGRRYGFKNLRQRGGLSGYPNRSESQHDWIESSHASTALSYAHGLSVALQQRKELIGHGGKRHVVAVVGDGSLTGGMAYEALNNLGHSNQRVVIVLNDNGRSYAPTISKLSESLTALRLNKTYLTMRGRIRRTVPHLPAVGKAAYLGIDGFTSVVREMVTPHTFFENLGVRYVGPIDGHDIESLETTLKSAAQWDGPIVVHVLTDQGTGVRPRDRRRLEDARLQIAALANEDEEVAPQSFSQAFSDSLVALASADERSWLSPPRWPGPTGLLNFQAQFPDRFFDVGIAEQHAVTAAAGMAMGGLKPVVAIYSTFFSRAFDQAHLDVGLLNLPVVFVFDRAGVTGDDGPSHHGLLDIALCLAIPNLTVFAPSSAEEVPGMLATALSMSTPTALRFPKTLPKPFDDKVGDGLEAREVVRGDGSLCVLAVGKMAPTRLQGVGVDGRGGEARSRSTTSESCHRTRDDRRSARSRASHDHRRRHATRRRRNADGLRRAQPGPGPRSSLPHDTNSRDTARVPRTAPTRTSCCAELGLDADGPRGGLRETARRRAGVRTRAPRRAPPELLVAFDTPRRYAKFPA